LFNYESVGDQQLEVAGCTLPGNQTSFEQVVMSNGGTILPLLKQAQVCMYCKHVLLSQSLKVAYRAEKIREGLDSF
jgi:hypothetical protein